MSAEQTKLITELWSWIYRTRENGTDLCVRIRDTSLEILETVCEKDRKFQEFLDDVEIVSCLCALGTTNYYYLMTEKGRPLGRVVRSILYSSPVEPELSSYELLVRNIVRDSFILNRLGETGVTNTLVEVIKTKPELFWIPELVQKVECHLAAEEFLVSDLAKTKFRVLEEKTKELLELHQLKRLIEKYRFFTPSIKSDIYWPSHTYMPYERPVEAESGEKVGMIGRIFRRPLFQEPTEKENGKSRISDVYSSVMDPKEEDKEAHTEFASEFYRLCMGTGPAGRDERIHVDFLHLFEREAKPPHDD